jgi:hypothetical protein
MASNILKLTANLRAVTKGANLVQVNKYSSWIFDYKYEVT